MKSKVLLLAGGLVLCTALAGVRVAQTRPPVHSTWGAPPEKQRHSQAANGFYQGPGTRRMVARLADLIPKMDPMQNPALSTECAARMKAQLLTTTDKIQRFSLTMRLADVLLCAGQSNEALARYDEAAAFAKKEIPGFYFTHMKSVLPREKAMAYMRLGEQQNCCATNNADSCLLPIQGQGIHRVPFGAEKSVTLLSQLLASDSRNVAARWSLNIGYMALGRYPWDVPPKWLIPPTAFRSDYPLPRFPNVAPKMGLDLTGLGGGCVMEDFDGDGLLDLMISRGGPREQIRFFHNNGDGTFTERTKEAGLTGETGGINLIQADYNNDGFPDVFVLRGNGLPNSLLRNNGDGTFEDVTEAAGLLSFHPAHTAVWLDYNGDGYLDLFVGNRTVLGDPKPHPCQLFRNNGDGTFTECAKECGLGLVGNIRAVASADVNQDGRPDIYITYYGSDGRLLRNDGPAGWFGSKRGAWRFTDVTASAHVPGSRYGAACIFFDYDNDGWPDLLTIGTTLNGVSEVANDYMGQPLVRETLHLYHNDHHGMFTDVTVQAHLNKVLMGQAVGVGDLDNDGNLDVYIGTGGIGLGDLVPKRMFRNNGGTSFQDVTTAGDFGHLQKGTAICFGDLFNNGQQDIYEVMGGACDGDVAHNVLFANPGNANRWIALTLEGVRSNRSALGARIRVTLETPTGVRTLWRTVGSGGSYGASPLRQEIGLGAARAIRDVQILWPTTGQVQTLTGFAMNQRYKIREGVSRPLLLTPRAAAMTALLRH